MGFWKSVFLWFWVVLWCMAVMICTVLFKGVLPPLSLIYFFTDSLTPQQHPEFNFLLRDRVCALVIKLFSPNIKYRASVPASMQQATPLDKPYFPIAMRLLRLVSVLIQKYYPLLVGIGFVFVFLLNCILS